MTGMNSSSTAAPCGALRGLLRPVMRSVALALLLAPLAATQSVSVAPGGVRAPQAYAQLLSHTAHTAQVVDGVYSADHPAARARGWWPVDAHQQPLPAPSKRHILFAQGNTWGGPPFFFFGPDSDTCLRVQALFSEFRRQGWTAWHVNYPAVAGSVGAALQPGPPSSWPEIPRLLAESVSWVRTQYRAETVVVVGRSAGGITWGSLCAQPDSEYPFPNWRPDGLISLESAPSLNRLANDAAFYGSAYLNADNWLTVPLQTKILASPLPNLAQGFGSDVAVVATFPPSPTLAQGLSPAAFLAQWSLGTPIAGYTNPHGAEGGLGLERDFRHADRAPFRVYWGDAALNTLGSPGVSEAGESPTFARETREFFEAALFP